MSVLNKIRRFFYSLGAVFLSLFFCLSVVSTPVFAEPTNTQNQAQDQTSSETTSESQSQDQNTTQNQSTDEAGETANTCYDESGSLGWLVCPTTGFLARITDGLYDIIQQMLVVKPLTSDSDSPFHQIWSIFRDITNVVFAIFFLVIIFSQVSGLGISNYGIKKLLPKIIISAILINLSYIICAALVDVSNIVGASLKGLFSSVEEGITATGIIANATEGTQIDFSNIVSGLIGGGLIAGLAIGASGGLGAIFISLLPVLLAAVFAVAIAYITIAARQAFVYLLIMVSPLAFVCNLLPNTEKWFATWKKSLYQMLFFYPMFAALFGACSLVGWTIIAAAEDTLVLIMGIAVKVVPLIACWSLLKMSGTLPGQINSALTKLSSHPVGALRNWSSAEAALRRAKYLGDRPRTWQYARKFGQSVQDRKFRTASDTQKYQEMSKLRGTAYASNLRNRNGGISRRGRDLTALIGQSAEYQRQILKNANDAEKGIANYATSERDRERLTAIDLANMNAADALFYETSRGEKVRFDNTQSRQDRIDSAFNAYSNAAFNATKRAEQIARTVNQKDLARYNQISSVLEGDVMGTHLVGANAAHDFSTQTAVLGKKFGSYFTAVPATQELYDRLFQLTATDHIGKDIDPILTGMKALNMRGDTDLVTNVMRRIVETNQIKLGTHASQAIANFCMFDVKDSDVLLRRYGKYINLETARAFNEDQKRGKRQNRVLSFNEYITGHYDEYDEHGVLVKNSGSAKYPIETLLMGTSLNGVERTTYENIDRSLRLAYTDRDGHVDLAAYGAKRNDINNAMLPAIITAALTYPSGSEQGINLASYITGLKLNEDGSYTPRWTKKGDPLEGLTPEYFADFTKLYLSAQVPSQITSLRTDTINPIIDILADDFIRRMEKHKEHPEDPGSPDPAADLPESATPPPSELPDWYSQEPEEIKDTDSDEEKKAKQDRNAKLAKKKRALRNEYAKANFMATLHKSKTLGPIIRSLSSGSVNSAKRVVRDFLGVSDDDPFSMAYKEELRETRLSKLRELRNKRRKPSETEPTEPVSETGDAGGLSDAEERELLINEYEEFAENTPIDEEGFVEYVVENLRSHGLDAEANLFENDYNHNPSYSIDDLLIIIRRILGG
ncbi:MFS transporter [Candidatus Saccharibacteria bacterium]|nr:MFS transporter [Candidatus Saccharibacteria bacterium]